MDYENLIERLKNAAGGPEGVQMCIDAATAIETLRADLAHMTAKRDAAVKDIWVAKWVSCKHGESCDFISAITGMPDCAGCGDWEWRGIKED